MVRHVLGIGTIAVLALAGMFYPFMPGTYDRMAVALSGILQVLGLSGLLLVPIGVVWLSYELVNRRRRLDSPPQKNHSHWFAASALLASLVAIAGATLAALQTGPSLAVCVLALCVYGVWRATRALHHRMAIGPIGFNAAPLYLIIVPSVLATAQLTFLEIAVETSRKRTIAGSARFINAIEAYNTTHGRYPPSLESVHHDYDPPTVGVERYRYEPHGQSYNVFFEHPTWRIGTQEFVMYNPRGEHVMMVHNQDLLESAPEEVERERGFHARAARDTGIPHWKYFWFD